MASIGLIALGQLLGITGADQIIDMAEDQAEIFLKKGLKAKFKSSVDDRVAELERDNFKIGEMITTKANKTPHPCTEAELVRRIMFDLWRDEVFTLKGGGVAADRFRDRQAPKVIPLVEPQIDATTPLNQVVELVADATAEQTF